MNATGKPKATILVIDDEQISRKVSEGSLKKKDTK